LAKGMSRSPKKSDENQKWFDNDLEEAHGHTVFKLGLWLMVCRTVFSWMAMGQLIFVVYLCSFSVLNVTSYELKHLLNCHNIHYRKLSI
jgi:hypothetical protein